MHTKNMDVRTVTRAELDADWGRALLYTIDPLRSRDCMSYRLLLMIISS